MFTLRDLAWTAGFLEGEGSFRLRANRGRSGGTTEVSAVQIHRESLDRLRLLYGGHITFRQRRSFSSRPIYDWRLAGVEARGLMMTLYMMMSPYRKAQIRTALDAWRSRPGTGVRNREKTACPRGHPYDTVLKLKSGPARRCSICYRAWWAENGHRYRRSAAP